jgi:hypothetical protein
MLYGGCHLGKLTFHFGKGEGIKNWNFIHFHCKREMQSLDYTKDNACLQQRNGVHKITW